MTGTIINTGAVLLGSAIGLCFSKSLHPRIEVYLKWFLGAAVIYVGFSTTAKSLGKTGFSHIPKQLLIVFLALIVGNAIGMALRLQNWMNKAGQYAKRTLSKNQTDATNRFSEGFVTASLLFCVGPLSITGSILDGVEGNYRILGVKSILDGLTSIAFAKTFGPGVLLSAIPVFAYQGTITLAARSLKPFLEMHPELLDAIGASGGLLVVCISVVILEIRKAPLANYLPSLAVAPLLAWWWGF